METWPILLVLLIACCVTLLQLARLSRQRDALRKENKALAASRQVLERFVALDDLTPAQSRRYLAERLDGTTREHVHALLYVDLDDFKSVNDGYGHEIGDALLIEISQALVDTCRPNDFVARLGGDEFCVYLDRCTMHQAGQVAQRFLDAVASASVTDGNTEVRRSASIGVTELQPNQSMVDALLIADAALYEAKDAGRNQSKVAGPDVIGRMAQRRKKPTSEEVSQATMSGEITYFVQPIFDIQSRRAVGVEALLRWVKPNGEILLPEVFFDTMAANYRMDMRPPLAAANDLAATFTRMDPPLFCAWNISSSFLKRSVGDSQPWIEDLLFGVKPEHTVFEIVESAVIDYPDQTRSLLTSLRSAGVRVALDDFGTGHSNLERLAEYPVDIVKIDRSFVQGIFDGANLQVIEGLVSMSASMGFDIIAEGVETQAQLDALQTAGVSQAQGFFLGRPNTVEYWHNKLTA